MTMTRALVLLLLLAGGVPPGPATAKEPGRVSKAVHDAIVRYLEASAEKEGKALERAVRVCKGDVQACARALRSLPPLTKARAGTHHGVEFESGGRTFRYSVHLPKGYDGTQRLPVLVLPDHGAVDEQAGIDFWLGKPDAERYILFRPVIVKHKGDRDRFPDGQFFAIDQALAAVMRDAITHLKLHYAVDDARFSMTGLSQAGYYTWYYAVSFPDVFAAIVPESAGGMAVRASIVRLARNLKDVAVRILHHPGDQISPYADATRMRDALEAAGGTVELISYTDADYGGTPFPKRHPGPHHLRLEHVLGWAHEQQRTPAATLTRVLRYAQQGHEGSWEVQPPADTGQPYTVTCTEKDGELGCDHPGAFYLVSPEQLAAKQRFRVGGKQVTPEPDVGLMLEHFKRAGDRGRLVAARIPVTAD